MKAEQLKELIAQWRKTAQSSENASRWTDTEEQKAIALQADMRALRECADELEAVLSQPKEMP